jgi:hypothetical protein
MDACLRGSAGGWGYCGPFGQRACIQTMRAIYLSFAVLSLATAALVWALIAGWAGRVAFAPDMELLASGEALSWLAFIVLMYGPIAFSGWLLFMAWRKSP